MNTTLNMAFMKKARVLVPSMTEQQYQAIYGELVKLTQSQYKAGCEKGWERRDMLSKGEALLTK